MTMRLAAVLILSTPSSELQLYARAHHQQVPWPYNNSGDGQDSLMTLMETARDSFKVDHISVRRINCNGQTYTT